MDNSRVPMSAMDDEIFYPPGFDDDYVESLANDFDPTAASDLWINVMNGSFDNLKMMDGTPAEMTRHETAPAMSSNPVADNVMPDMGAPSTGPVTPSGPQHTPATQDCLTPVQHESAPLYWTNPSLKMLISVQGHASWAPPAAPQTEILIQDGAVAPQPQGATDCPCPGSSNGGRKRRATNAFHTAKTTRVKKPKEWQRETPYENEEQEKRRLRAIKARSDRENKKNEFNIMKEENQNLKEENQNLKEENQNQKGIIQQLQKELMKAKQEILNCNQQLMEQKLNLNENLQQLMKKFSC